jgi:hypothetical protein
MALMILFYGKQLYSPQWSKFMETENIHVVLKSLGPPGDLYNSCPDSALDSLSLECSLISNITTLEFKGAHIDKYAVQSLEKLIDACPRLATVCFGKGCDGCLYSKPDVAMTLAITKARCLSFRGSIPGMGHIDLVAKNQQIRDGISHFEPLHWSYRWSSTEDLLPLFSNATNATHTWLDLDPLEGTVVLVDEDDEDHVIVWSVKAANIRRGAFEDPNALQIFSLYSSGPFQNLFDLTVSKDIIAAHSDSEIAQIVRDLPTLKRFIASAETKPLSNTCIPKFLFIASRDDISLGKVGYTVSQSDVSYETGNSSSLSRCRKLKLLVDVSEGHGLYRRRVDAVVGGIVDKFQALEELSMIVFSSMSKTCSKMQTNKRVKRDNTATVSIGGFAHSLPKSSVELSIDMGGPGLYVSTTDSFQAALSGLSMVEVLSVRNWRAESDALYKIVAAMPNLRRLEVPNAFTSTALFRRAMGTLHLALLALGANMLLSSDISKMIAVIKEAIEQGRLPLALTIGSFRSKDLKMALEGDALFTTKIVGSYFDKQNDHVLTMIKVV